MNEPSFLIKVMPLLGHAGLPQKKQFSTRIFRLETSGCLGTAEGSVVECTTSNWGWCRPRLYEKKLTAFAPGRKKSGGGGQSLIRTQADEGLGL